MMIQVQFLEFLNYYVSNLEFIQASKSEYLDRQLIIFIYASDYTPCFIRFSLKVKNSS